MLPSQIRQFPGLFLVVLLVTLLFSSTTAAAITVSVNTQYGGIEADTQAISSTMELSPEGSRIINATITIQSTNEGFVDFGTFAKTVDPATSDAQVTYAGAGTYQIDELEPNEQVTITFDAYPKTVKSENLTVATVRIEYIQNGQELQESRDVRADLQNSSWFAYQDSQARVKTLENQLQQRQWMMWLGIAGILAAVGSLGYLGFIVIYS